MSVKSFYTRLMIAAAAAALTAIQAGTAIAAVPVLSDAPLFLNGTVAPLNMLVMGRDHKLYYEAYNDHTDLDSDGTLDVGYDGYLLNPDGTFKINYYGYFDSFKCYTYDSGNNRFNPASVTANKKCSGQWSGDWLNYITMSRIDALRKVLYGGYRSTDGTGASAVTVLERSLLPQDAHSWGKSYESVAKDGYNITEYTPLSIPAASSSHLFVNTTLLGQTNPLLRVITNKQDSAGQPLKIWNWVSIERPVGNDQVRGWHRRRGQGDSPDPQSGAD